MRALAAGGNPIQATRVDADCRRPLREHAASSPSAETVRLLHELTDGAVKGAERRDRPAP